jgi:hypothetical protein
LRPFLVNGRWLKERRNLVREEEVKKKARKGIRENYKQGTREKNEV